MFDTLDIMRSWILLTCRGCLVARPLLGLGEVLSPRRVPQCQVRQGEEDIFAEPLGVARGIRCPRCRSTLPESSVSMRILPGHFRHDPSMKEHGTINFSRGAPFAP